MRHAGARAQDNVLVSEAMKQLLQEIAAMSNAEVINTHQNAVHFGMMSWRVEAACCFETMRRVKKNVPNRRVDRFAQCGITEAGKIAAHELGISRRTLLQDARVHECFFASEPPNSVGAEVLDKKRFYVAATSASQGREHEALAYFAAQRAQNAHYSTRQAEADIARFRTVTMPLLKCLDYDDAIEILQAVDKLPSDAQRKLVDDLEKLVDDLEKRADDLQNVAEAQSRYISPIVGNSDGTCEPPSGKLMFFLATLILRPEEILELVRRGRILVETNGEGNELGEGKRMQGKDAIPMFNKQNTVQEMIIQSMADRPLNAWPVTARIVAFLDSRNGAGATDAEICRALPDLEKTTVMEARIGLTKVDLLRDWGQRQLMPNGRLGIVWEANNPFRNDQRFTHTALTALPATSLPCAAEQYREMAGSYE